LVGGQVDRRQIQLRIDAGHTEAERGTGQPLGIASDAEHIESARCVSGKAGLVAFR
jgi:hypothetical protein